MQIFAEFNAIAFPDSDPILSLKRHARGMAKGGRDEEDFSFSTTDEDDFKGSEYEKDGNVNKVTHGIARKKPYIIQINANHLYTFHNILVLAYILHLI